jgi:hypothetical protein
MITVTAPTITRAWLEAISMLLEAGGDLFTSVLQIEHPGESIGAEVEARALIDAFIADHCDGYDTQTVASTLFPVAMTQNRSTDKLYSDYITRTFPMLRRSRDNRRGTYFLRMIDYATVKHGRIIRVNQLDTTIKKMRRALAGRGPMRNAYEIAIYHPGEDAGPIFGFPCLSHISFKLDTANDQLHLVGIYRNQTYIERLYGNLLGLSRLQRFAAKQIGFAPGRLICHATHAHLGVAPTHVRDIIRSVAEVLDSESHLTAVHSAA